MFSGLMFWRPKYSVFIDKICTENDDGGGKCKLPSTVSSTGLSRIQHWDDYCEFWILKRPADVFMRCLLRNHQCDTKCHSMTSGVWPTHERKLPEAQDSLQKLACN